MVAPNEALTFVIILQVFIQETANKHANVVIL
jgi:hypothetical protein